MQKFPKISVHALNSQDMGKNIKLGFFSKRKHWNRMYDNPELSPTDK